LNATEIAKHNNSSDCFLLISGKVYNITSFFGSHPGGNATMAATCGTDATAAYYTKDPYATSTSGGRGHSSNAQSMLASYYVGDLNQAIGVQAVTQTNSVVAPTRRGNDEWDD
ncbi:cytochrome b5 domain-containing protein, partial [Candidatus Nomurabacteria bacterium]|nr:cytochrome b5 domain-containing protein [Candidatus Nomurabacteria bacterium]